MLTCAAEEQVLRFLVYLFSGLALLIMAYVSTLNP
jgi:hypothetical protein